MTCRQEEVAIHCPGCRAKVADGTSICPKCDYIIDASFLSGEPPTDEGEDDDGTPSIPPERGPTRIAAPPTARQKTAPQRPSGTRTGTRSSPAAQRAPSPRQAPAAERPSRAGRPPPQTREVETDPGLRSSPEITSPGGVREVSGRIAAPEDVVRDLKSFLAGLAASDKYAVYGALGTVFSCFLPWRFREPEGDVLGLTSLGFVAFLLALVTLTAVVVRTQRLLPRVNPIVPWVAQLAAAGLALLWCVICIKLNTVPAEPARIGMPALGPGSPSFGVYLAVLGSLVSLGGTLLGLKEKPS